MNGIIQCEHAVLRRLHHALFLCIIVPLYITHQYQEVFVMALSPGWCSMLRWFLWFGAVLIVIFWFSIRLEKSPFTPLVPFHEEDQPTSVGCLKCGQLLSNASVVHCRVHKPPGTHHCKWCNRCVLQYDHHCFWTGVCIGDHNYHRFLFLLAVGTIYALVVAWCFAMIADSLLPPLPDRANNIYDNSINGSDDDDYSSGLYHRLHAALRLLSLPSVVWCCHGMFGFGAVIVFSMNYNLVHLSLFYVQAVCRGLSTLQLQMERGKRLIA